MHTITLHCRLHNQALTEAVMPLVGKLSKGKELGEALTAKVRGLPGRREQVQRCCPTAPTASPTLLAPVPLLLPAPGGGD